MSVAPPFTAAVLGLLLLSASVEGVRRDGLVAVQRGERESPLSGSDDDFMLQDSTVAVADGADLPVLPEEVPPDFFCRSCQELSKRAEKFLSDPSLYDHANNLSSEVCHVMRSSLQIKCRRIVELYLHEGILILQMAFSEKNLCNSTGFCPADDSKNLTAIPSSVEPPSSVPMLGKQLLSGLLSCIHHGPRLKSKTCNTCHTFAAQLIKELEDHDQQMAIMQYLLDVCGVFKVHTTTCKVWVFEYGPIFLANLHKFLMLRDVCRFMHICAEPPGLEKAEEPSMHLIVTEMGKIFS